MSHNKLIKALLVLLLLFLYLTPISGQNELQNAVDTEADDIDPSLVVSSEHDTDIDTDMDIEDDIRDPDTLVSKDDNEDTSRDIYTTEQTSDSMETTDSDDGYYYDSDDDDSESQSPETTDSTDTEESDEDGEESTSKQTTASIDSDDSNDDDTQSLSAQSSETDGDNDDESFVDANASNERDSIDTTQSAESADDESSNDSNASADADTGASRDTDTDTDTNRRSGRAGSLGQNSKNENANVESDLNESGELNWVLGISLSLISVSLVMCLTGYCYLRNVMMKDRNMMMSGSMALEMTDTDAEEGIAMTTHLHHPSMILTSKGTYGRLQPIHSGVQLMEDRDSVEVNIVEDVDDILIQ